MKQLIFLAVLTFFALQATAQKSKTKTEPANLSFLYKKGDYILMATINKGDKLVYACNVLNYQYDLIITINDFTQSKIDISYSMTNAEQTNGRILMTGFSYKSARKYTTDLIGKAGEINLEEALAFWFSEVNFNELEVTNKTSLKLDDNAEENFQVNSASIDFPIKYKGQSVKIDTKSINNQKSKSIILLNNFYNRLIIKMSFGASAFGRSIELKEIK